MDSSGNLYIADTSNHVIRMVTTGGTISTIAGTNTGGYAGDGGPAINAELEFPTGVAVDKGGNIYIADSGNNVIREISGGNINTIVGGVAGQLLERSRVGPGGFLWQSLYLGTERLSDLKVFQWQFDGSCRQRQHRLLRR